MEYRKFGALTSSQNPEEIANRVKGGVLACSSIIIFVAAQFFNVTLSANDVVSLATQISGIAGAVWMIYGFILSVIAYFAKK
jgi:hypothetical protein